MPPLFEPKLVAEVLIVTVSPRFGVEDLVDEEVLVDVVVEVLGLDGVETAVAGVEITTPPAFARLIDEYELSSCDWYLASASYALFHFSVISESIPA